MPYLPSPTYYHLYNNYAQHCIAMLCSLLENNSGHEFCVHVLINSLSEHNKALMADLVQRYGSEIVYHIVDESPLEGLQYRKVRALTKAAYYLIKGYYSDALANVDAANKRYQKEDFFLSLF